jgi:hypothetical protein
MDLTKASHEELQAELEARRAESAKREGYPPAGAAVAEPAKKPAPPPPTKTDAEWRADMEQRMKDQESFKAGLRSELWREWQIVQDQCRSELEKFRAALLNHGGGGAIPEMLHECARCKRPIENGSAYLTLPEGLVCATCAIKVNGVTGA